MRVIWGGGIWSLSSTGFACAVCGFGEDESRGAFLLTTGLLTFIPLIFMGSVVGYLFWRARQRGKRVPLE